MINRVKQISAKHCSGRISVTVNSQSHSMTMPEADLLIRRLASKIAMDLTELPYTGAVTLADTEISEVKRRKARISRRRKARRSRKSKR